MPTPFIPLGPAFTVNTTTLPAPAEEEVAAFRQLWAQVGDAVELVACHGDELIVGGHVLLLNAFVPGGAIPNSTELQPVRVKHAAHVGSWAPIEV